MDNLTHTLFALTLARTPLGRAGRGTATALVLASNAPDIDIATTARSTASYLQWHRGPTHGLIGILTLGLLVALLVRAGQRIIDRRGPRPPDDPDHRRGDEQAEGRLRVVGRSGCSAIDDALTRANEQRDK